MTLQQQAEALLQEALGFDAARRDAAAVKRRAEMAREFLQLGQDVEAPAQFLLRCRERGVAPSRLGPSVQVTVRGVQQNLEKVLVSLRDGDQIDEVALADARRSLVGLAQRLTELAHSVWTMYCDRHLPRGQGNALLILEAVVGATSELIELKRLDEVLEVYRREPPLRRPQDVDTFLSKLTRRQVLWERLDVGDLPSDVQRFLMEVPSGAPLPLLTRQVLEWLGARGLLGRYRVVAEDD